MRRAFVIVAIVLIVLAVTNPTRAEYIEWAKEQSVASQEGGLARFLASTLSGPVLEMSTQAKNYVFFSLFRTGDRTILGICHRFIPLP